MQSETCARCNHNTFFPQWRETLVQKALQILLMELRVFHYGIARTQNEFVCKIPYCPKCWIYINLSKWSCDNCKSSGTIRISTKNPIKAALICLGKLNAYKKCQCGNKVELTAK